MEKRLRQDIHTHYENWLAARGFSARPSQLQMIDAVVDTLLPALTDAAPQTDGGGIAAIEAPTGTGKTVAYLVAALSIARALGKKLVVSVSTVTLQEQLVRKDLPELSRDSGLQFNYALAKGRGRYLCRLRLEQLLEQDVQGESEGQGLLYPDESSSGGEIKLYRRMRRALIAGDWDGDRDAWDDLQTQSWRKLTVARNQCTGRKCRHYSRCSFYSARQRMHDADCIVANHDLVLTDLFLGGGALLPPLEDSVYIFDEAHQLADKALKRFARRSRLGGEDTRLERCRKQLQKITAALEPHGLKPGFWSGTEALFESLSAQLAALEDLLRSLLQSNANGNGRAPAPGRPALRFAGGAAPEELRRLAAETCAFYAQLESLLQRVRDKLDEFLEGAADSPAYQTAEAWLPPIGELQREVEEEKTLWATYAREDAPGQAPSARWLELEEEGRRLAVSASPVQVADNLRQELWSRCRAAILCSATLRALDSFDYFTRRIGLPPGAALHALPQVFDYANAAELIVPDLGCTPKQPAAHTRAVADYLKDALREPGGTLALFASRKQLYEVHELLPAPLRRRVLLQRDGVPAAGLLEKHKRRVDETGRSAILGLASFAEGVDLPGDYCLQLIIAKLFFAPPDDPVMQTFSEWVESRGGNPFTEISTPDAALRLVQACGRLLRSEQDTGKVVLLDPRVITMQYGRAILDSLPPFRVRSELRGGRRRARTG